MKLRKATYLIRAILIAVCFQFTAPVIVVDQFEENSAEQAFSSQKHSSNPISLSSLFEKTESEGEEERSKFEAEALEDLSLNYFGRIVSFHSIQVNTVSFHLYQTPLFRLFCVYLI